MLLFTFCFEPQLIGNAVPFRWHEARNFWKESRAFQCNPSELLQCLKHPSGPHQPSSELWCRRAAAGWCGVAEILLLSLAPSWEIHSSLLLCNCAGVGSGIFRLLITLEGLWWDQIPDLEGRWEAPEGSRVQLMMCRFKTGKHVPMEPFFPKHCAAAY